MTARADAAKAERRGHTAPVAAGRLRPLTERILARLPGPRAASIVAWALVPWLNAGANVLLGDRGTSAVWEQSDVLVVLNYAAISVGVLVSLWGSDRIARQLERLGRAPLRSNTAEPFRSMNSRAGPPVASAVTAVVLGSRSPGPAFGNVP